MDSKLVRLYELEKCVYNTARELNCDLSECLKTAILDQPISSEYTELVEYSKREEKRVINYFVGKKEIIEEVDYEDTMLYLSEKITSVKGTVFPLNVTHLDLSFNKLTSLEGVIFPSGIRTLNLSENKLRKLGTKLPSNLVNLYLSENQLQSFDDIPSNLEVLYISSNKIKSLEGLPQNLMVLNCPDNKIKTLISSKGSHLLPQSLRNLYISNNELKSIEGLPTKLVELEVEDNKLTSLPLSIVDLQLRVFEFSENPINFDALHPSVKEFIGESIADGASGYDAEILELMRKE
jgi:Leucine-rich repeat (LRR) protein